MKRAIGMLLIAGSACAAEPDLPQLLQGCVSCHGPRGVSPDGRRKSLAGRDAQELYLEMLAYKEGRRPGHRGMTRAVEPLTEAEIMALAVFYSRN